MLQNLQGMKNNLFATAILVLVAMSLAAQPMQEGEKSIAINVNPVFRYIGNFFSDNENYNNDLNLSGAGLIYRSVYKENRALRLSANIDVNRSTDYFESAIWEQTSSAVNAYASIALGQEFFKVTPSSKLKLLKTKRSWRKYAGYDVRVFGSYNQRNYGYEPVPDLYGNNYNNSGPVGTRVISDVYNQRLGAGMGGFAGIEYYFSDHFFIGLEARASFFVAYQFDNVEKKQEYFYDRMLDQVVGLPGKESRGGEGLEFGFDSGLPIIFRAGFTF